LCGVFGAIRNALFAIMACLQLSFFSAPGSLWPEFIHWNEDARDMGARKRPRRSRYLLRCLRSALLLYMRYERPFLTFRGNWLCCHRQQLRSSARHSLLYSGKDLIQKPQVNVDHSHPVACSKW
jgi:hypothetical protein